MVKVLESNVRGPLASYAGILADGLLEQGFTRGSAERHIGFVAHLDRWLLVEGLGLQDLDGLVIRRYLAERRADGYVEYLSVRALGQLLAVLGPLGVLPVEAPARLDAVQEVAGLYRDYLLAERGLLPATVGGYLRVARAFLSTRLRGGELDLAGLGAPDVFAFVVGSCAGRPKGSAKVVVSVTRSLLGWLALTGRVEASLAAAVPAVAGWRLAALPQPLPAAQVRALLSTCDRGTPVGCRDYAMLVLLTRLGLRCGEVAGLGLDDIDWRAGQVRITGKGSRVEDLPLPADVGAAILDYLRHGRPVTAQDRAVFVRVIAPHRGLAAGGVGAVVTATGRRAGLGHIHAHQLRHSAATAMLAAGSPLAEVGQVLRHRRPASTAIYAKVDQDALSVLVGPWPAAANGGVS